MTSRSRHAGSRGLRRRRVAAVLAAAGLAVAMAACGSDDDGGNGGGGGEGGGGEAAAKEFKAVALLSGTTNDGTFSQAIWEGMEAAKEQIPGLEVRAVGPITSPDAMIRQGTAYAKQGYDLVFVIHGALVETVPTLAERFPDTKFCGILEADPAQLEKEPENVCYFDPEQQFGSFMGGAAAALVSKTGHIGAVAAIDFPILTRQSEGFQLGARCVNPDIKYNEVFTGDFNDPSKARSAAQSLYSKGADVVLGAVDAAVQGIFTAAEAQDGQVWVIPQYFDNYDKAPEVVLTSVEFGLQQMAQTMVTDASKDQLKQQYNFTDVWKLSDFRDHAEVLGEEKVAQLEEMREKVLAGEIEVPDETKIGKRGTAKDIDPKSIGC